jgi:apolipoprotein D and lipocalin family protein
VEKFSFNKANYYVLYLDNDYAIEYDCNEELGVINYCVHIMARALTIDNNKLEELKSYALGLGLNPRGLAFHRTEQFTCRNSLSTN